MVKKKYTMLILILALVLVLFGMLSVQVLDGNYAVTGRKLASWNGEYTIGVPRNWDACDASSSTALIAAKTSREDMYLLVSLDSYDYGPDMNLDIFISNYMNYVAGNSDQVDETKMLTLPETITVDEISGYYYEYAAPAKGMQLHLFCFASQTPDGFLTIQVACNEAEADVNREMAKNIISSLRIHKEQVQTGDANASAGDAAAEAGAAEGDAAAGAGDEAAAEDGGEAAGDEEPAVEEGVNIGGEN